MPELLPRIAREPHRLRDAYAAAARVVAGVLAGRNIHAALEAGLRNDSRAPLRAAAQDLAYRGLRAYGVADGVLAALRSKPLPDPVVRALFYVAIPALRDAPDRAFAIVDEAVEAVVRLGRAPARGLVNAILRNYARGRTAIEAALAADEVATWQHPQWWIDLERAAFPDDWAAILATGNQHPPMALRVNPRRTTVADYRAVLARAGLAAIDAGPSALVLETPVPVARLPHFEDGFVSVHDVGAQLAAPILDARAGMRVLDACAAPGGKTGHILERADVALTAIDRDADRLRRVEENLQRLGLHARLQRADCARPETWWDGRRFDRILADVPCSASGVVRRDPDIKWLRRAGDIAQFARQQATMLGALWRLLAPGGRLLYVTCSLFPPEGDERIAAFLDAHPQAIRCPIEGYGLDPRGYLRPGARNDGFFYALIEKP